MVLIVALVMLVVIGLASVAIMRNALSTDLIGDNNRLQTQALQAAQAGLKYCESRIRNSVANSALTAATTPDAEAWHSFSNWHTSGQTTSATDVPIDYLVTVNVSRNHPSGWVRPQCLAQKRTLASNVETYVITARGFSDNYVADTQGHTKAGAEVWLQSVIQVK